MGSIGPAEILVVLVVALVVLGPNRLPDAARQVGKALAELRKMTAGVQAEVRSAFNEQPPTYPDAPAEPAGGPPPTPAPEQSEPPAPV
ncbi:MAG TPA: Sec-independent protein translocase protein TatB [Dermatophilaceae bacterium]|nr:Sec-independent protein translocase protein TatB [Dermatophilaceae bacterium]